MKERMQAIQLKSFGPVRMRPSASSTPSF